MAKPNNQETGSMKTAAEVAANPDRACPLELSMASIDVLSLSIRAAANRGDRVALREAMRHLRDTADMVLGWMSQGDH